MCIVVFQKAGRDRHPTPTDLILTAVTLMCWGLAVFLLIVLIAHLRSK